jgi:threonine/homoserine/homoserine lactone efflux protein
MSMEIWVALAAANFVASLAPGQNVAYLGAATVRVGLRGGLAAVAGILVAELLWSLLALSLALGARKVSPELFEALQLASAFVLVWLGVSILRDSVAATDPAARRGRGRVGCVAQGVWVGLANPLALIFFLSLFPGFVSGTPDLGDPSVITFYVSAVLVSSAAGPLRPISSPASFLPGRGKRGVCKWFQEPRFCFSVRWWRCGS